MQLCNRAGSIPEDLATQTTVGCVEMVLITGSWINSWSKTTRSCRIAAKSGVWVILTEALGSAILKQPDDSDSRIRCSRAVKSQLPRTVEIPEQNHSGSKSSLMHQRTLPSNPYASSYAELPQRSRRRGWLFRGHTHTLAS